jgi:hypothetical protein
MQLLGPVPMHSDSQQFVMVAVWDETFTARHREDFSVGILLDCVPWGPFSDRRNCQTSGASRRLSVVRLPCCICILLDQCSGAGKMFSAGTAIGTFSF